MRIVNRLTSARALVIQQRERCPAYRARDRIRRVRVAVEQGAMSVLAQERIEYLVRSDSPAKRQRATRQPLAQTDDVRCNPGSLAREQRSGAAEPGEHFVRDEEDIVVTRP